MNYGARTPMTTVAAPMVHDTIPVIKTKSYTNWPQLPYFRFPKFEYIKNNDIVVFNYPVDTMYNMYLPTDKRYDKPIDKKTNYVKRCVGIPGDSIAVKDGDVYVNGKKLVLPERAKPQYSYKAAYDGKTPIDLDYFVRDMDITDRYGFYTQDTLLFTAMTAEAAARLKNIPGITSVTRNITKKPEANIFPVSSGWNGDNFGPIYIPKEGITVKLDLKSLPFYKKIISEYEHNNLKVIGNDIYVNEKIATTYTFKQDYYWMMGDNRHNSLDSRYWGYVPADHIVGKPVFVWMSWNTNGKGFNKIRWERMFTTVSGDGQPQSYFKIFLVLLALYFAIDYGLKKRREKKANS
jgi:signal peptidase I